LEISASVGFYCKETLLIIEHKGDASPDNQYHNLMFF